MNHPNKAVILLLCAALSLWLYGCGKPRITMTPAEYLTPKEMRKPPFAMTSKPIPLNTMDISKKTRVLSSTGKGLYAEIKMKSGQVVEIRKFSGSGFNWSESEKCYEALLNLEDRTFPPNPSWTPEQLKIKEALDKRRKRALDSGVIPKEAHGRIKLRQTENGGFTAKMFLYHQHGRLGPFMFVDGKDLDLKLQKDTRKDILAVDFKGATFGWQPVSNPLKYELATIISGTIVGKIHRSAPQPQDPAWWSKPLWLGKRGDPSSSIIKREWEKD